MGANEGDGGALRPGPGEAGLGRDAVHGMSSGACFQYVGEQKPCVQEHWEGV